MDSLLENVEIILDDEINEITMNLNRTVLCNLCEYFRALLNNFKEKNMNQISLKVHNAYICRDIITSFYGLEINTNDLPMWQYLIDSIICCDFWGIKIKNKFPHEMNVPPEGFENLLKAIHINGYTKKNLYLLVQNLPENYDLLNLDRRLRRKLIKYADMILVVIHDNKIKIFNINTKRFEKTLNIPNVKAITSICVSRNYKKLIIANWNKTITIWDINKDELVKTLTGHSSSVTCLCISYDNQVIVSGSFDRTVKIWNMESGENIKTLIGHINSIINVCISPNDKLIVSCSEDKTVKIWDAKSGDLIRNLYTEHKIINICILPNNKEMLFGGSDGIVRRYNTKSNNLISKLQTSQKYINSLCLSFNKKFFATGSSDRTIKIWSTKTNRLKYSLITHADSIKCICVSSNNKKIISSSYDNNIKIWKLADKKIISFKKAGLFMTSYNHGLISKNS